MRALRAFVTIRAIVALTFIAGASISHRALYSITSRWDAQWYARIAEQGYGTTLPGTHHRLLSDYAFFPLFPFLERCLHWATDLSFTTSGVIVSLISSIAAAIAITFIAQTFAGQDFARALLILWAVYPLSALLWMSYSESLFTALASWSLYFVIKKRWFAAGLSAALVGATRPIGLAIVAVIAIEALLYIKRYKSVAPISALILAPLGWASFIAYADIHSHSRTIFAYFNFQKGWGNGFDGGIAFFSWIGHALLHQPLSGAAVLAGLFLVLWALIATCRMAIPRPLKLYAIFMVAISLSSAGYFSSKPRYLIPAFILLAPLAAITSKWSARRQVIIYSIATVLAAIAGALWLLGSTAP